MNEKEDIFIAETEKEIGKKRTRMRYLSWLQWVIMISVGCAGLLTSLTGTEIYRDMWFTSPDFLVIWGIISTIGALVNQAANPNERIEKYMNTVCALKAIVGAVKYQNLPINEADQIRTTARQNGTLAINTLQERFSKKN